MGEVPLKRRPHIFHLRLHLCKILLPASAVQHVRPSHTNNLHVRPSHTNNFCARGVGGGGLPGAGGPPGRQAAKNRPQDTIFQKRRPARIASPEGTSVPGLRLLLSARERQVKLLFTRFAARNHSLQLSARLLALVEPGRHFRQLSLVVTAHDPWLTLHTSSQTGESCACLPLEIIHITHNISAMPSLLLQKGLQVLVLALGHAEG